MTATCKECGVVTRWDDDAGSAICPSCGTLADPSQTILADSSHLNVPSHPTILKSFRTQGHNLAGQGKESRDVRNHHAMSQFITSLALSINASGLSPRATLIFTQAMAAGKFRWGRKAKLVAGASLVLALREYHRPDSLADIAYLLDVQSSTLVRTFTSISSLLNLSLTHAGPSVHIQHLLTYLTSLLAPDPRPTIQLPAQLVSQLHAISLRAASNTARSLCTLISRLGPDHPLNSLSSPPTAIATFLLSLEAEGRTPLSHLGDLSQALGASCHKTSRSTVMARYKLVQDEIYLWIEQVPWLGQYEKRGNTKNRAKQGKRLVVARGIADVLRFQDEIWRGKLRPTVQLDLSNEKNDEEEPKDDWDTTLSNPDLMQTPPSPLLNTSRAAKRRKLAHHPLQDATQFLLMPLSGPLPTCQSPPDCTHAQIPSEPSLQSNNIHTPTCPPTSSSSVTSHLRSSMQHPGTSLPSYILTAASTDIFQCRASPTRLQLLAAARGGSDAIEDDELFVEGELEGLIRSKEEAEETGRRIIGLGIWNENEDEEAQNCLRSSNVGKMKQPKEAQGEKSPFLRKSRVNLDALSRFLENPLLASDDNDDGAYDTPLLGLEIFSDKDEDDNGEDSFDLADEDGDRAGAGPIEHGRAWGPQLPRLHRQRSPSDTISGAELAEIVVDEWRPMSPEAGGPCGDYEEEYD
ncbi:hypothetical protein H0H93_007229 [Arthromyces matolae]|nr:hypothetical protein H0H93_007229 [Arthromyces matolae]